MNLNYNYDCVKSIYTPFRSNLKVKITGVKMAWYSIKVLVSALLIAGISEIAKRSSLLGAILASVPLVSVLAMIWMYVEDKETQPIIELSRSIAWLIIPSLTLFIVLPWLLQKGMSFYLSLLIGNAVMISCYGVMIFVLKRVGISLT